MLSFVIVLYVCASCVPRKLACLPLPTYFTQRKCKKNSLFSVSESKSKAKSRTSISQTFTDMHINVLLNFMFWHIWQNLLMNMWEFLSNVQMSRNPCHSNEMTEQNYIMYAYSWDKSQNESKLLQNIPDFPRTFHFPLSQIMNYLNSFFWKLFCENFYFQFVLQRPLQRCSHSVTGERERVLMLDNY